MWPDYNDIKSRIAEPPTWYTSEGVPRWGVPTDGDTNIYADEGIVILVGCQGCDSKFHIVWEQKNTDEMFNYIRAGKDWPDGKPMECTLVNNALNGDVPHMGDPPRHDCVGDTMNSIPFLVSHWWRKNKDKWEFEHNDCYIPIDWDGLLTKRMEGMNG